MSAAARFSFKSLWPPTLVQLFIKAALARTPYHILRKRVVPKLTLNPIKFVLAFYEARQEMVTIVQVGACDGMHEDPIRPFLLKGKARAILIEPNPFAFSRLQKTYAHVPNITLVPAAISEKDGEAHLYRVKSIADSAAGVGPMLGIASFDRDHLLKHGTLSEDIERITVRSISLPTLVAELGLEGIDLLQIDVEGYDAEVARMALELTHPPKCINLELYHLSDETRRSLFSALTQKGYLLTADEWDLLALKENVLEQWQTSDPK